MCAGHGWPTVSAPSSACLRETTPSVGPIQPTFQRGQEVPSPTPDSPPMTPARAHSLRPRHPAQQQLAVGMGGEARVEAGMCAGVRDGAPARGRKWGRDRGKET